MMHQQQTKLLVGLGANQLKTAIGFHMKQLESKGAVYLKIVLRLMNNTTLNIFRDTRIVNISTVSYLDIFCINNQCITFKIQFGGRIICHISIIFIAKLLVTTGIYFNSYENGLHSEVIDIDNEDIECNELANSAYPVQGAAGGLVSEKPMICGGFYETPLTGGSDKCFILGENLAITMEHERSYPSSISISKDEVSHFPMQHGHFIF